MHKKSRDEEDQEFSQEITRTRDDWSPDLLALLFKIS
jgi:hypothetical protein